MTDEKFNKLFRWAARAPEAPAEAPFGFPTRIVARWKAGELPAPFSAWEFLSVRSVSFALLIMIATLALNFELIQEQFAPQPDAPDALVEVMFEQ